MSERKKKELAPRLEKSKRRRDFNLRDKRPNPNASASAMSRLMCYADEAGNLQIDPLPNLPYLLELVGENLGANNRRPFLLPIATVQKLKTALCSRIPDSRPRHLVSRVRERTPAAFTGDNHRVFKMVFRQSRGICHSERKC